MGRIADKYHIFVKQNIKPLLLLEVPYTLLLFVITIILLAVYLLAKTTTMI